MEQRMIRRYGRPGRHRERDPYLPMLTVQILLCGLVVTSVLVLYHLRPEMMPELRTTYQGLLMQEGEHFRLSETAAMLTEQYLSMRDAAVDAVGRMMTDLVSPQGIAQEVEAQEESHSLSETWAENSGMESKSDKTVTEGAETSTSESTAVLNNSEEMLNGMGGWLGIKKTEPLEVPASCSLGPVFSPLEIAPPTSGRVTSFFGFREHPITESDDFHRGLDIAAPEGSGIYTPLPGRVVEIDQSAIYGNYITIDHGNGLLTTYSHCLEIVAPMGANLRKGELVALVGSTGMSTGPHCHFELRKDGIYYNPAWVLDGMDGYGV